SLLFRKPNTAEDRKPDDKGRKAPHWLKVVWGRIKDSFAALFPVVDSLQLVDGGVFDNQGIQGLADRNCSHMLVSDGAQRMPHAPHPSPARVPVLGRSTNVLMTQVRHHQVTRRVEASMRGSPAAVLRRCRKRDHGDRRETASFQQVKAGPRVSLPSAFQ